MRKITLLLICTSFFGIANAQFSQESGQLVPISERSAQAVIFDQSSVGGSGIVSDVFTGIPGAVYSADDFTISEENIGTIETITVFGFQNQGDFTTYVDAFNLYIYADNNGAPAGDPTGVGDTALLALENLPIDGNTVVLTETVPQDSSLANSYDFTVDITAANGGEFNLEGGSYWIVAAPSIPQSGIPNPDLMRWNWFDAGASDVGAEAHLIDPDDLFGGGFTTWTSFSDLGLDFGSTAFTIEGTEVLSVSSNDVSKFSIFPNPVSNEFTITSDGATNAARVVIYDVLGKIVLSQTEHLENVNISTLSNGLYVAEIYGTNNTKTTQKIVKQ